jgi:hypothetical protein
MKSSHRILALAALLICLSVAAQAQTVEVDNALVFYFDEEATQRSVYGTGQITAYLIAGPMLHFDGTPCQVMNSWGFAGMGVWPFANVASARLVPRGVAAPAFVDFTGDFLGTGFMMAEPLPLDGRTVIAELVLDVISDEPTELVPCDPGSASGDFDGVAHWFNILTSGPHGPMDMVWATATINGPAPVSNTDATMGGVKALYH